MAICAQPGHIGGREVFRTITFYRDNGEKVEGCRGCVYNLMTPLYPTEKREIISQGTHRSFNISPAHTRHIRLRKLGSDGRTVYQNRRGNVT